MPKKRLTTNGKADSGPAWSRAAVSLSVMCRALLICDAFTLVRIPSGVFHIIQKRHAVTGLFGP